MRLRFSLAAAIMALVFTKDLGAQTRAAVVGAKPAAKKTLPKTSAAKTPTRSAPLRKAAVRKTPVRRWRPPPPVVIPANYIVRPQLDDLPELAPPLENLQARELSDSFAYRRYDGAIHWGIDIFRPSGDPLFAVVDGIVHLAEMPLGGLVVYLTDATGEFRFYYAHLDAYPEGLRDGSRVRQGDLIGYVGNSGNARYTKPHLHFEVHLVAPWLLDELGRVSVKAAVLNPCPLLRELVARQGLVSAE
jgi:peptidoglycan LD-endopeptidase LytH